MAKIRKRGKSSFPIEGGIVKGRTRSGEIFKTRVRPGETIGGALKRALAEKGPIGRKFVIVKGKKVFVKSVEEGAKKVRGEEK